MPHQLHPEITHQLPWAAHADTSLATNHLNDRIQVLCGPLAGNIETQGVGGTKECMYLGVHVESH